MNFLLHFRYAERDHQTRGAADAQVVGLGAMLPDLWKMADRRTRLSAAAALQPTAEESSGSSTAAMLSLGLHHHWLADRWFHQTPSFVDGEKQLRHVFFQTGIQKLLMFAHPAWEMCLDGALMRQLGRNAIQSKLAFAVQNAQHEVAAVCHTHAQPSDALGSMFFERMTRLLDAACTGYLFDDYSTPDGIAFRTFRMRSAFGFEEPTPKQFAAVSGLLEAALPRADQALLTLDAAPPIVSHQ